MRIKLGFILLLFLVTTNLFGQNSCDQITFVLMIDGDIPIASIDEASLQIRDNDGKITDQIPVRYEVGKLIISSASDCNKFQSLKAGTTVFLKFKYRQISPTFNEYVYERDLKTEWLKTGYLIFKVYNYASKINRGIFPQKKGYGIETITPFSSTILPRKKK